MNEKTKVTLVSIFPKYSALWNYAHFLEKYLSKNKNLEVEFLDLWKETKYHNSARRALALLNGIAIPNTDVLILIAPLLSKSFHKSNAKLKIGIVHDLYPIIEKSESFAVKLLTKATYPSMKDADLLLAVSNNTKKEVQDVYTIFRNIETLHGGIDHTLFKKLPTKKEVLRKELGLPVDKKILFHVGRSDARKNVQFILNILRDTAMDETVLLKVGSFSKTEEAFIKKYSLENKISMMQDITEEKMCKAYNAADIFVFPSLYEGLGIPPIEAMACGCPVLAADNSGLKEACPASTLLPLQETLWKARIQKILHDARYRKKVIAHGLKWSKQFDWQTYAKEIQKIIQKRLQR